MAFHRPLVEESYAGPLVCAICGERCNGSAEPTGPVLGEGPEWAWFRGDSIENFRPQPARPGNTNASPDSDPTLNPASYPGGEYYG